jgi:hypothetical protein
MIAGPSPDQKTVSDQKGSESGGRQVGIVLDDLEGRLVGLRADALGCHDPLLELFGEIGVVLEELPRLLFALADLIALAPEMADLLRKLTDWQADPDASNSDAADLAVQARALLSRLEDV